MFNRELEIKFSKIICVPRSSFKFRFHRQGVQIAPHRLRSKTLRITALEAVTGIGEIVPGKMSLNRNWPILRLPELILHLLKIHRLNARMQHLRLNIRAIQ